MVVILNFKTYLESSGKNAAECAEAAYIFAKRNPKHTIIICPQTIDIENILKIFSQSKNFKIWSQHVDFQRGDKETGYLTVESLKAIKVSGSLLNHAEHKVKELKEYVALSKEFDICLCTADIFEANLTFSKYPDFTPRYLGYEPPSLIGGDISVASANPHDIEKIVDKFTGFDVLAGAGIKKNQDVLISKKLGVKGIIMASGYVFAPNKLTFLNTLLANC